MKRYGILHGPILSWGSPTFYRDVARNWKGICGLYLLLLVVLTWIPLLVQFHSGLSEILASKELESFLQQVPEVTIKNGQVSTNVQEPHTIWITDDLGRRKPLAVIDTTGKITSLDQTEAVVLLTGTDFMTRKNPNQVEIHSLSQVDEFRVDRSRIESWVDWVDRWALWLAGGGGIIGEYLLRLLQMVIYALIGLAFAAMLSVRLSYGALCRLSVVAVTPVLLVGAVFNILGVSGCWWTVGGIALALTFLFVGVRSCRDAPAYPTGDDPSGYGYQPAAAAPGPYYQGGQQGETSPYQPPPPPAAPNPPGAW